MRHFILRRTAFIVVCLLWPAGFAHAAPLVDCHTAQEGDAQFRLGYQYERGDSITGIKQDYQAAMKSYQEAAQRGSDQAMFRIGYMYERGLGVAIDKEQARAFYTQAAAAGSVSANIRLGNADAAKAISDNCTKMMKERASSQPR